MALNISEAQIESASELYGQYEQLLKQLQEIENKYSLNYVDTSMNLPETLGLEKLTYEAPSDIDLKQLAEDSTLSSYLKNLEKIESSEQADKNSLNNKIATAENALAESMQKLQSDLSASKQKAQSNAVAKGTARGSILESAQESRQADFEKNADFASTSTANKISILDEQLRQVAELAKSAMENLDETRDADIQTALTKLLKEVQSQQDSITKYNNTVDEKENKYLASRETTLFNAKQKEAERARKAGELYAQLGEIGYQQQISNEKINLVKNYFSSMSKAEAMSILNSDSALKAQLGQYYNYILDYVSYLK